MATIGALPAAPAGIGTDPEAQQAYVDALSKVADSLENRGSTNWFNVAQGFLAPTRGGSFAESASNAAGAIGKDIEREKELAPSLAMMRAQIAGQKYTMQNDAKALALMGQTLGVEPTQVPNALSSGNINADQSAKLQSIYPLVASLSPARGEILKNMIGFSNEATKAGAEKSNADVAAARLEAEFPGMLNKPAAQPAAPQGFGLNYPVEKATISSPFGERKNPMDTSKTEMHGGIDFAAPLNSPVQAVLPGKVASIEKSPDGFGNRVIVEHPNGSTSYYAHLNDVNVKQGDELTQGQALGTVGSTGKSTGPHIEFGILDKNGKPIDPSLLFQKGQAPQNAQKPAAGSEPSGMGVAGQQAVLKEQSVAGNKQYNTMRDALTGEMPDAFVTSNAQLDRLHNIATRKDANQIFGVLQAGDEDSFVKKLSKIGMSAGDEGVTLGDIGHLKSNFDSIVRNSTLKTEQKAAASEAANILANQVIMNLKTSRQTAFGARLTNYEDMQMQAINSNMNNIPQFIDKWAAQRKLENSKNLAIRDAYSDWVNQKGENYANTHLNEFFNSKDSPFRKVPEKYAQYYSYLSNNYKYKPQQ